MGFYKVEDADFTLHPNKKHISW